MKTKKIIFYRHTLLSRGGDKMVLAHASYLAEKGHLVELWTSRIDTVFPIHKNIRVFDIKSRAKLGTLFHSIMFKPKIDLVIADIIPLACLLALRNRSKMVYFAQDYDESYYSHLWQRLFIRTLYFLGLTILKIRTIAVADHLAALLRLRFKAYVETVDNGVDCRTFYPDPDPLLLDVKEGRKAIVLLSRKDPRKGFDLGLKIIDRLHIKMDPDKVEIWTVGEPIKLGLLGGLHRDFGYVGADRLRQIFSSADAFLYHTRHEGFPLMALEALACGCPMVASEAVSVVRKDEEALISPVGDVNMAADQLGQLFDDPSLFDMLRMKGFEFSKKHSLDVSSRNFEQVLLK